MPEGSHTVELAVSKLLGPITAFVFKRMHHSRPGFLVFLGFVRITHRSGAEVHLLSFAALAFDPSASDAQILIKYVYCVQT